MDLELVHAWISDQSYWAQGRTREVMDRSIEHSLVIGVYSAQGAQAGFARFVTDYATFAWLCDVFIDTAHRGHGLGSFLVDVAVGHHGVREIRQVLSAAPGRTLYRRYGFSELTAPERWMERLGSGQPGQLVDPAQSIGEPEFPGHVADQAGRLSP